MNDWQKRGSAEGVLLSSVRAIVDWFAGLDAMAVVFGTCLVTCVGAFLFIQFRPAPPSAREPGASVFSQLPLEDGAKPSQLPASASSASSLEFAPRMPAQPEPPPEPSPQPEPQSAAPPPVPAPMALPQLPALPAAPKPNPGAMLTQARNAVQGGAANNGFAAGARIGNPAEEKERKKAGAIGGQKATATAAEAEPAKGDLVRQLIPIIQAFTGNGIMQGYASGGQQRSYAVEEFGKTVMERSLFISTSTIIQSKDAQALAEGLGVHMPKLPANRR